MKYLILGAGPAGLSFAQRLLEIKRGDSFLILEKEKEAGGLCRSALVDGAPLDIGGGHFLDVRREAVNAFLFRFMPGDEWELYERDSRILFHGREIGHPLEANIWQMEMEDQVRFLASIARAGCNSGADRPGAFKEWIRWKLGDLIAGEYMLPYNAKMFGQELDQLGTYWLEKLPDVSFEDTLRSCLQHKAYGKQPGHASFLYPKHFGYGELWRRMAEEMGEHVCFEQTVSELDPENRTVRTLEGECVSADRVIVTIPWTTIRAFPGTQERLTESLQSLKHTGIVVEYRKESYPSPAHWIYVPDPEVAWHRLLLRENFCPSAGGYWTETNAERYEEGKSANPHWQNAYAYPLNTVGKPEIMQKWLTYCESRGVYGLGRWGEWNHYNSDVVVERAIALADRLEGRAS